MGEPHARSAVGRCRRARAVGALAGLACGDALGTTLEFTSPRVLAFPALLDGPHREITGGGPFRLKPGQVTDDTQMACRLAASIGPEGLDLPGLVRAYVQWAIVAFDVGGQTASALEAQGRDGQRRGAVEVGRTEWVRGGRRAAGNGSLMRTAPVGVLLGADPAVCRRAALDDSAVTHFDPRCQLACASFDAALAVAIHRKDDPRREDLLLAAEVELGEAADLLTTEHPHEAAAIEAAARALRTDLEMARRDDPELHGPELHLTGVGAGFVRAAYRLAFWELLHAPSFEAGVVDVVNRGGDADTNGAIAGALLGAFHGDEAIPLAWRLAVMGAPPDERLGAVKEECHPFSLLRARGLPPRPARTEGGSRARWSDRKALPMPEARAVFGLDRVFTAAELCLVDRGVVPVEMEDKWFVYRDGDEVRFHRSWTGNCIFTVHLETRPRGAAIRRVEVNRDPEQHSSTDDGQDAAQLSFLVDVLLLGKDVEFPGVGSAPAGLEALAQWSVAGRAILKGEAGKKRGRELEKAIGRARGRKRR